MSDRENITDQENINEFQIEEVSTYPINNNILYRERVNKVTKHSFNYVIIKEGVYPNGTQTGPKSLPATINEKKDQFNNIRFYMALNPKTKATFSGPLVFGLQLKSVKKARESSKRGNLIKPAINCISSTLEKCAKKIASKVRASFNNDIKGVYHQSDEIVSKSVEFLVNKLDFQLDYEEGENQMEKGHQLQSI
ncbi:unnamed protein product [Rhizophagus irregularis]|nr:unnamed protein product [Rhizophagus irregularis]